MNGKFVRLFEESLLNRLLKDHDPRLHVSDYVLGIPKNNLNPITRLLTKTEFLNDSTVAIDVASVKIIKQCTALTYKLSQ